MQGNLFVVILGSLVASALCNGRGGGDHDGERHNFFQMCQCSMTTRRGHQTPNPCADNNGTNNICGWGTSYLSCSDTVCSSQTCPFGQLWNSTALACVPCSSGYHIAANYPVCVCDQGTTFNRSSQACVACPKNSEQLADECFCNSTSATPFFSRSQWACLGCPGQYVTYNYTVFFFDYEEDVEYEVCQCPGANDIFDMRFVSCVTCPSGATAAKARIPGARDFCVCPADGQWYNERKNTCECWEGTVLNSDGTACEDSSNSDVTTASSNDDETTASSP